MESSRKIFAAIVAAGILGAGSVALAQPGPGGCDGHMGMMRGGMKGVNFDPAARAEQHLAQLKSDLKLTAVQEPLWQAFAEKDKNEAGKGFQAMRDQAQDLSLSAPERMSRRTEALKQRVAAMESVNASFKTLYDALTVDQKRVADIHASRMGQRGPMGHMGPRGQMGPRGDAPPQGMGAPVKG
jgi:periplasmic protein CpxP/Spy